MTWVEQECAACEGTGAGHVPSQPCRYCGGNAYVMAEVGPDYDDEEE